MSNKNETEQTEPNVILVNRMCTGSYIENNIGHEIINYFKADGKDGKVYIYISPIGTMDKKYDNKIKTILLTSSLSNHKIEIIAKIDNPTQEIFFKETKNKESKQILKEQQEKYENIKYGGKTLKDIFENNKEKQDIYINFSAEPSQMQKPKKHIYITDNKDYEGYKDGQCKYLVIKDKSLASSSLKQYFEEEKDTNDYSTINKCLEDKDEWESFNPKELTEKTINEDKKDVNFLQLIEKEDEEQIYTNMIWHWLSKENIFNNFLEHIHEKKLNDHYELLKEEVVPGGRTDILAVGEKNIIVIENKIQSGINGIEKGSKGKKGKTQLSKYISGIQEMQKQGKFDKKDGRTIKGFIFVPDYRENDLINEINKLEEEKCFNDYYKIITYSELYKFFSKDEIKNLMMDDLYKDYYPDFLSGLKSQSQRNISDKNRIEMERKFIYAIKRAKLYNEEKKDGIKRKI